MLEWGDNQTVTDPDPTFPNNLYSVLSLFGVLGDGQLGFDTTDQAFLNSIDYVSKFNNFELNKRFRWFTPNSACKRSVLVGMRWVRIDEDFVYVPQVAEHIDPFSAPPRVRGPGTMGYRVETINDVIGPQIGGDLIVHLKPRLRVGLEGKGGVFVTRAQQKTTIETSDSPDTLRERVAKEDLAGVGEIGIFTECQLCPTASIRLGYSAIFVQNIALAPEQFNPVNPFIAIPPPGVGRTPFIEMNGDLTLHGFSGRFELTW